MQVTLIGYGKMGVEIEKILNERGHCISKIIQTAEGMDNITHSKEICIDFTAPDAFKSNYKVIADNFSAAVVGTTGWDSIEGEVVDYFKDKGKSLVYASNFSIGVNIFFEIAERASKLTSSAGGYDPYIIELHHKEKKDAPSGTAKTIEKIIGDYYKSNIQTASVRSGNIKGIHEAGFESAVDKITLRHEAYSREGFALGAVMAAEWVHEEKGIWNFRELLNKKLNI
jgi:4-hydroxy-tetrahydrodipicolinate reductase